MPDSALLRLPLFQPTDFSVIHKHSLLSLTVFAVGSPRDSDGGPAVVFCCALCFLPGATFSVPRWPFLFYLCRVRVSACACCAVFLRGISHAASACAEHEGETHHSTYGVQQATGYTFKQRKPETQTATRTCVPAYSA